MATPPLPPDLADLAETYQQLTADAYAGTIDPAAAEETLRNRTTVDARGATWRVNPQSDPANGRWVFERAEPGSDQFAPADPSEFAAPQLPPRPDMPLGGTPQPQQNDDLFRPPQIPGTTDVTAPTAQPAPTPGGPVKVPGGGRASQRPRKLPTEDDGDAPKLVTMVRDNARLAVIAALGIVAVAAVVTSGNGNDPSTPVADTLDLDHAEELVDALTSGDPDTVVSVVDSDADEREAQLRAAAFAGYDPADLQLLVEGEPAVDGDQAEGTLVAVDGDGTVLARGDVTWVRVEQQWVFATWPQLNPEPADG